MDAESCDILPPAAKPTEAAAETTKTMEVAMEEEEDNQDQEETKKQLESELVEVSIDGGDSDKEAEGKRDEEEEEEQDGGVGGGGGKQKQRRPKKGFVQSLLGVLKKSSTKGFAATPSDSPQQTVSSKSFLRGLRPLISRIRKNEAPAVTSGSSSGSSLTRAAYSDKDVQTAIREVRDNLQGAHDVAEKIFSQNMGD